MALGFTTDLLNYAVGQWDIHQESCTFHGACFFLVSLHSHLMAPAEGFCARLARLDGSFSTVYSVDLLHSVVVLC